MKLSRAGFTRPGIAAALELMVNASVRIPAQTSAGRFGCPVIQGTLALPELDKPEMMAFWAAVGQKIEVGVRRGTAFCESCRRPSKEPNRKVLSFFMGKPTVPPNCSRLSEFLTAGTTESGNAGSKACPFASAELNANGSRASIASLRKNP